MLKVIVLSSIWDFWMSIVSFVIYLHLSIEHGTRKNMHWTQTLTNPQHDCYLKYRAFLDNMCVLGCMHSLACSVCISVEHISWDVFNHAWMIEWWSTSYMLEVIALSSIWGLWMSIVNIARAHVKLLLTRMWICPRACMVCVCARVYARACAGCVWSASVEIIKSWCQSWINDWHFDSLSQTHNTTNI